MSFYPASIPRCQHIKVNGIQCGSPALHRRRFCFFHHQWRQERIAMGAKRARQGRPFDLPVLEDANAIQITLMQIMRLILRGQIDPKSAGLLLYALQTASVNLRNTQFEPRPQTRIVLDPRDVPATPLDEDQWSPDDFEEEEEEPEEAAAEEAEAQEEEPEAEEPSGDQQAASELEAVASNEPRGGGCPHPGSPAGPVLARGGGHPPGRGASCRGSSAGSATSPGSIQPPHTPPQPPTTGLDHKKPPASTPGRAANDQRPSLACPERSEGTNDHKPPRWYAPDGTPVTDSKLDQLRMLTQFLDYLAPLPPGEEE